MGGGGVGVEREDFGGDVREKMGGNGVIRVDNEEISDIGWGITMMGRGGVRRDSLCKKVKEVM